MRQKVKFARQRAHTTEKEKQRMKHGLTVTSARLPSGCPCCSIAATCGHHRWDWAFPHGSHKQRTHCLVSVFSQNTEITETKAKKHPHSLPSPSSLQNKSFGATEAHAATLPKSRSRSGQKCGLGASAWKTYDARSVKSWVPASACDTPKLARSIN